MPTDFPSTTSTSTTDEASTREPVRPVRRLTIKRRDLTTVGLAGTILMVATIASLPAFASAATGTPAATGTSAATTLTARVVTVTTPTADTTWPIPPAPTSH